MSRRRLMTVENRPRSEIRDKKNKCMFPSVEKQVHICLHKSCDNY